MTSASWDAGLYGRHAAHHRAFDDRILDDLRGAAPGRTVLDVGCGVGDFSDRLASALHARQVTGIDSSAEMVRAASARSRQNLSFEVVRAQDVADRFPPCTFDVVCSTAALHWIPAAEQPALAEALRAVLRPGGLLRVEFGGRGQIAAARRLLNEESQRLGGAVDPFFFPDAADYRELLRSAGFTLADDDVWLERQRRRVPDATALRGWLESQVLIAYEAELRADRREPFRRSVLARALAELRRSDGTYDQDYVRLHARAWS